ncbi:MAG: peptidylprolyl isomerase [Planctomycetia bacterium]|nr:peptidylprolyl isomerase [Planctomycetia bacterium]
MATNRRVRHRAYARFSHSVAACLLGWLFVGLVIGRAAEQTPPASAAVKPAAVVNGVDITEAELAAACLERYGSVVVGTLINKAIIQQAIASQNISVTTADVDAEIDSMSRRFKVSREQWLALIERERGVNEQQYRSDIVWPMIALRRLARGSIDPTDQQLEEQFQNQFGPTVKARIIVQRTAAEAAAVRAEAIAQPDDFSRLAREKSVDVGSASVGGWVQPIRKFAGSPAFEEAAFALAKGEISNVIQVADQFIVIKCEGHLPAAGIELADVRDQLADALREKQSREFSTKVFSQLQEAATIENVLNDSTSRAASPEVAALVNGQPIPISEVREVCVERYGRDVLEMLITQVLLNQALSRQQLAVNQADVDAEVTRAAETLGFRTPDGQPDIEAWLKHVSQEQKQPVRHYIDDIVRPTVALKKLIGSVPVTREDLDKAFAATFGPRARCRVIVLDSQRRAQEVWQLARQQPTAEKIGDLAEQYSVDPTSKALRGEVPPIQRFGGQPALEREAFGLEPGELSGVIQIADRFMVLFCEGFTEPVGVTFAEVRDELYRDILEKKQRIEMARFFTHLRQTAAIDNFLAGTSQSPVTAKQPPRTLPAAGEMPASTLSRREAADLSEPRAGSRQPQAPAGVQPATFESPAAKRR